ncbi:MAG: trigger factor [Gemmatimonadetes bacterium]|nr:trigger factor [Gemmatimonadota bacterium]
MTLDPSNLQISVTEHERWRRSMSVTVPASVVHQEEKKAAVHLAGRSRLKGFRKGHVPPKLIESRFGDSLRKEALDRLIGEAYRSALVTQELRPISEGQIQEVTYEPDQDLVFSIEFDVQPVIELEKLGGFVVERPSADVNEEHIAQVIQRVREQNGEWKPAEDGHAKDGDVVSVRIMKVDDEAGDEGKEYEFLLGQGDALPDIEAAIRTLDIGASGEFDVAFPDDFPDESRRGDSERIQITVLGRKELELPPLDDDLAKKVGDFETLADLEARIKEDLEKDAKEQSESVVRVRLLDFLLEANPFEVPLSMVDRYAEGVIGEQQGELEPERLKEVKESIRPEAERAVQRILMVEHVAHTQTLTANDDDIDVRVQEIAEKNNSTAAQVYASLQKAGRLEMIEREITETRVFEFLKGQSEITDATAT